MRGDPASYQKGLAAERLAAWALRLKGYAILGRRIKSPVGEIDLLAKRGRLLIAVEVKARPTLTQAAEAIPPRQWQRVSRALEWWLSGPATAKAWPNGHAPDIRFDAVLVAPGRWPRHIPDAWRP